MGFAMTAYAAASSIAYPFIEGWLRKRHAEGFDERQGMYPAWKIERLKPGKTLWLHAVSVGEVQAARPIADKIAASGWDGAVLLSTVTETGAQNADMLMGPKIAARVFAPWDIPRITRRAADAIGPAVYATVETEVWPNILFEMKRRGIPALLINGRISDRSLARAKMAMPLLKEAYGLFDALLARSEEDAARMSFMGAERSRITVTGDTKVDAIIERRESAAPKIHGLREKILPGGGVCFVAGSTHPGEDEAVLEAFGRLRAGNDPLEGAKLVIVPRHPARSEEILQKARLKCSAELYSNLRGPLEADILIVDVIGTLFELYGLATAAFIGGSLVPRGGQNILEPAIWDVPVLHGPHMENFARHASELDAAGMSFRVETADDIERLWRLVADDAIPRKEGSRGYFAANSGAAERTLAVLGRYLALP